MMRSMKNHLASTSQNLTLISYAKFGSINFGIMQTNVTQDTSESGTNINERVSWAVCVKIHNHVAF